MVVSKCIVNNANWLYFTCSHWSFVNWYSLQLHVWRCLITSLVDVMLFYFISSQLKSCIIWNVCNFLYQDVKNKLYLFYKAEGATMKFWQSYSLFNKTFNIILGIYFFNVIHKKYNALQTDFGHGCQFTRDQPSTQHILYFTSVWVETGALIANGTDIWHNR